MKEVIKNLLKQGHLIEPNLIDIFSHETLSRIPFTNLIIDLGPPRLISKKFFLTNIPRIIEKVNALDIDKETLMKVNNYLMTFLEKKPELKIEEREEKEELINKKKGKVIVTEIKEPQIKKIEVKDFVKYFRDRFLTLKTFIQDHDLKNLTSIGKISTNRRTLSIIGMIYNKRMTKNKNLLFEVEDLTGKISVLVNHNREEIFEKAKSIVEDEVIGITGIGSDEIIFVNNIIFPGIFSELSRKP